MLRYFGFCALAKWQNKIDRRSFVAAMGASGLLAPFSMAKTIHSGPSATISDAIQDVRRHGAVGNGATRDDAAFQAAVDNLPESGGIVHIPPGTYLRTAPTETHGKPILFAGSGQGTTFLKIAHPDNDIFVHSGVESAQFRDFTLFSSIQRTGGAYIRIDPGVGKIAYSSSIERVRMYGHHVGIDLVRCSDTRIRDCPIIGNALSYACVLVRNLTNVDSGDNSISGCFFSGAGGAGIRQESSGGLRLLDNKFNGLVDSFILCPQYKGSSTSILIIQGNSFENASRCNIFLQKGEDDSIFTYGSIIGNEFGYTPISIHVLSNGVVFQDFVISGNIFAIPEHGIGIMLDGGNTFCVKNNLFRGVASSGDSIKRTKNEMNPQIEGNIIRNLTS